MTPISPAISTLLDQPAIIPSPSMLQPRQERLSEAAPAVDPAVVSRAAELAAAAKPEASETLRPAANCFTD